MPNIEPLKCPTCAANIQLSDRECPSCGATLPGVSQEESEAITPTDEILDPTRPDEGQEKEGDALNQIFGGDEVVEATEPAKKSPPEETVPSPFPPPTAKPKKKPEAAETIRSPFPPPNVKGERKRKQKPPEPEPQKSSSKKWLVILAILAVISLLSCAGFAVFSMLS